MAARPAAALFSKLSSSSAVVAARLGLQSKGSSNTSLSSANFVQDFMAQYQGDKVDAYH